LRRLITSRRSRLAKAGHHTHLRSLESFRMSDGALLPFFSSGPDGRAAGWWCFSAAVFRRACGLAVFVWRASWTAGCGRIAAGLVLLVLAAQFTGCGPTPVVGGTRGSLRDAGGQLSEMQITVHRSDGGAWHPIGFGVTADDGSFALVTNGAQGPLLLPPGDYRCTLESVGAPVQIPAEYVTADSTPLQVTWSAGSASLDLAVPVALLR
jgi:hypothetical protein